METQIKNLRSISSNKFGKEYYFCDGNAIADAAVVTADSGLYTLQNPTKYFVPAITVHRLATLSASLDPTSPPSSSVSPTQTQPVSNQPHNLSVAEKSGISLGTIVLIATIIAIVVWYIWMRRARKKEQVESSTNWEKPELDAKSLDTSKGIFELMGHQVHEIQAATLGQVHEMQASTYQPVEMDIARRELDSVRGVEVDAPRRVEVAIPRSVEVDAPNHGA
jgi:hypothetical protein